MGREARNAFRKRLDRHSMLGIRPVLYLDVRSGHAHQLIEALQFLHCRVRDANVLVAVKQPDPAIGEVAGIVDLPFGMRADGCLLQLICIRLLGKIPACLLEVAPPKMSAHGQ